MSRVRDIQSELMGEWSRAQNTWNDSHSTWKDAVAAKFAKRFLEPWEADMPAFLSHMETLEQELQSARRDLT